MGQYGEIIYTRVGAAYNLKGSPLPTNNGYAVFNISKTLFDQTDSRDLDFFRNKAIQLYKYSKCPVDSFYAYVVAPEENMALLGRYTPRTQEDAAKAAAARVDARASHIAHFMVGRFDRRPTEMLESPFFNAHKLPIAAYYSKSCASQPAMLDSSEISPGSITQSEIIAFVNDGRREAVKICAAKLLEQNGSPLADWKTIVIVDSEPNVRMWIASITSALPLHIACNISFCTCAKDLSNPTALSYELIEKQPERFSGMKDLGQTSTRHLLWRLAGAVPGDRTSSVSSPIPVSLPLLILDGDKKIAQFMADPAILQSGLIKRIGCDDSFLHVFDHIADEMKNLPTDSRICAVFDAVSATTHPEELTYEEMCKALTVLLPHSTPQSRLARELEHFLLTDNGYQKHFAGEDRENNLSIMRLLMEHADSLGWNQPEIVSLAVAAVENAIANPSCSKELLNQVLASFSGNNPISQALQDAVIGERRLKCLDATRLPEYQPEQLKIVLGMASAYIHSNKETSWSTGLLSGGWGNIEALVDYCMLFEDLSLYLLDSAGNNNDDLAALIFKGAMAAGKTPDARKPWWRLLVRRSNLTPELICEIIAGNKNLSHEDLDNYMSELMRQKGCAQFFLDLFKRYLGAGDERGKACREVFIDFLARSSLQEILPIAKQLLELLESHDQNFKAALCAMESKIDLSPASGMLAPQLNAIAMRNKFFPPRSEGREFLDACQNVKKSSQHESLVDVYLRLNPNGLLLYAPAGLKDHQLGQNALALAAENSSQPEASLLVACAFHFDNADDEQAWLDEYASMLTKRFIKKGDPGLVSLCALEISLNKGLGVNKKSDLIIALWSKNNAKPHQNIKKLTDSCLKALSAFKPVKLNDDFPEVWEENFGIDAVKKFKDMLNMASDLYNEQHKGGIAGKLFGALFGKSKN